MPTIYSGRFTAKTDQPFVVFLIGMRVNKVWAVHKWLPVAQAMGPMLTELYRHPEKGFLGGTYALTLSGPLLVHYWRSFQDLEQFARNPDDPHWSAWKRFYKYAKAGRAAANAVGIWHETYLIQPDQYEAIYAAMPKFGLGSVMEHIPATGKLNAARDRLNKTSERGPQIQPSTGD